MLTYGHVYHLSNVYVPRRRSQSLPLPAEAVSKLSVEGIRGTSSILTNIGNAEGSVVNDGEIALAHES